MVIRAGSTNRSSGNKIVYNFIWTTDDARQLPGGSEFTALSSTCLIEGSVRFANIKASPVDRLFGVCFKRETPRPVT